MNQYSITSEHLKQLLFSHCNYLRDKDKPHCSIYYAYDNLDSTFTTAGFPNQWDADSVVYYIADPSQFADRLYQAAMIQINRNELNSVKSIEIYYKENMFVILVIGRHEDRLPFVFV